MYNYGEHLDALEQLIQQITYINSFGNFSSELIGITAYVFMAIGMYAIAKRRGIDHPWLAWIPFGSTWLLGCISDQYRYAVKGQEKSKRKVMLGLEIGVVAAAAATLFVFAAAVLNIRFGCDFDALQQGEDILVLSLLLAAVGLFFVMLGLAVTLTVLRYMALFDLYASCAPENATIFTVLSIVLSLFGLSILQSIFVFAIRNKDTGMPPRYQQIFAEQLAWQQHPVEHWEKFNEE